MDNKASEQRFYGPLKVLWDYLRYPCEIKKADCIIGFGNYNCDIALRASQLFREGCAEKVMFSGGLGRNTLGLQSMTEADRFAQTALRDGLDPKDILIENRSTNTAENIAFARKLLEENGVFAKSLIIVHQPFMERRIKAAFDVYWPTVEIMTTSYETDIDTFFEHAVKYGVTEKMVVEEVVGDFQRMELYADKGWQSRQEIPQSAWDAYNELIKLGYDGQLA